VSTFRGTTCDQCKADGKHPGHGLPAGPLAGWHRITTDTNHSYDFCSIKCAVDWLKERKRQHAERARRERALRTAATPPNTITGIKGTQT